MLTAPSPSSDRFLGVMGLWGESPERLDRGNLDAERLVSGSLICVRELRSALGPRNVGLADMLSSD